jgi:uncharacterized membrane protein
MVYQAYHASNIRWYLSMTMLSRDHFVSRFLYITTSGVKCHLAAVKKLSHTYFTSVFFLVHGIIDVSTISCWELSSTKAGNRGLEVCCTYSLYLMYKLNQTESAIFIYCCCDLYFRWISLVSSSLNKFIGNIVYISSVRAWKKNVLNSEKNEGYREADTLLNEGNKCRS